MFEIFCIDEFNELVFVRFLLLIIKGINVFDDGIYIIVYMFNIIVAV